MLSFFWLSGCFLLCRWPTGGWRSWRWIPSRAPRRSSSIVWVIINNFNLVSKIGAWFCFCVCALVAWILSWDTWFGIRIILRYGIWHFTLADAKLLLLLFLIQCGMQNIHCIQFLVYLSCLCG